MKPNETKPNKTKPNKTKQLKTNQPNNTKPKQNQQQHTHMPTRTRTTHASYHVPVRYPPSSTPITPPAAWIAPRGKRKTPPPDRPDETVPPCPGQTLEAKRYRRQASEDQRQSFSFFKHHIKNENERTNITSKMKTKEGPQNDS